MVKDTISHSNCIFVLTILSQSLSREFERMNSLKHTIGAGDIKRMQHNVELFLAANWDTVQREMENS